LNTTSCPARAKIVPSLAPIKPEPSMPIRMVLSYPLLLDKLDFHFHSAGHVKSFHARIDFADDDDAGVRDLLAIMAIEHRQVRTRRPIDHVSNLVPLSRFASVGNRSRQMTEFFSSEEIVHRQRERQQGNEVPCRLAVDQSCSPRFIADP